MDNDISIQDTFTRLESQALKMVFVADDWNGGTRQGGCWILLCTCELFIL